METPRKFIIAIINLRGVSTKLNKYIVFTMQTYKKLIKEVSVIIIRRFGQKIFLEVSIGFKRLVYKMIKFHKPHMIYIRGYCIPRRQTCCTVYLKY